MSAIYLTADDLRILRDRARAAGTLERWSDLILEWAETCEKVAAQADLACTVLAETDRILYEWIPTRPDLVASREYVMTRIDQALADRARHPEALPLEKSWEST